MRRIVLSLLLLLPAAAWAQDQSAPALATTAPQTTTAKAPTASPAATPKASSPSAPASAAPATAVPTSTAPAAPASASAATPPTGATTVAPAPAKPAVVPTAPVEGPGSPDARFDKTGDGLVDAADWALMTDQEKRDYARASLKALGEDPDAPVGNGQTRLDRYLAGLRSVYE